MNLNAYRYLIAVALVALVLVQVASAMHLFGWHGPAGTPVRIGGPFSLAAPDGRTVTDRDFRDRWRITYFGYTSCPDSCPTALNDLAGALDDLGAEAKRVAPIFITIDPAHDTPTVMGAYAGRFDPRIIALTGTPAAIHRVEVEYRVAAVPMAADAHGRMTFDHSSMFVVQDPYGAFAAAIDGAASPDAIAAKLRALIR